MIALSEERLRGVLSWLAIVLLVFPVGGAVWLGVAHGESPCILCWAQRTSILLIALVVLFAVRYGPRPRYVGLIVVLGAWGVFMGLRHWSLHIARDVGQGFAGSILGIHTYTWSWIIHWAVLLVGGGVLLFLRGSLSEAKNAEPGRAGRFAMALVVVMAAANALQAFVSTGPPPFFGQADPVRLSLDPSHWVWSMGEAEGAISWRGSWTIPEPDASAVDPDPRGGPLMDLPELAVVRRERIGAPLEGRLAGFAATAPSEEAPEGEGSVLAVTRGFGVYLLDEGMSVARRRVVLDPHFSVELTPLAGAAFLGPDTLAVMATNKSYALLAPDPGADEQAEWRHFLETDGGVRELSRSRFTTVRAHQMYALSLAYDPAADELITVTVPSPRHQRLVVSRFSRDDFVLSSEFEPKLGPAMSLRNAERSLAEYYVTGAAVANGRLYAVSAAFSTLLVIDLDTERVTGAYTLPGIEEPVGLAVRGEELFVAGADGEVVVLALPTASDSTATATSGSTGG